MSFNVGYWHCPKMATHPEVYVRLPSSIHRNTLILLHGTSQTGPEFAASFLSTLFLPPADALAVSVPHISRETVSFPEYFPSCKFVFPTGAPKRTTVFGGKETNAWFDITDFQDRTQGEANMLEGMRESSLYLTGLITHEIELLDRQSHGNDERQGSVVVAGFSQGSAMGILILLGGELQRRGLMSRLDAFIGLSGWLPFRRQIEDIISDVPVELSGTLESTKLRDAATAYVRRLLRLDLTDKGWTPRSEALSVPIFLGHGDLDMKVKPEWGLQLRDTLRQLGLNVDYRSYANLGHWWDGQEMTNIAEFLHHRWQDYS